MSLTETTTRNWGGPPAPPEMPPPPPPQPRAPLPDLSWVSAADEPDTEALPIRAPETSPEMSEAPRVMTDEEALAHATTFTAKKEGAAPAPAAQSAPMPTNARDLMIRTVIGEAGGEPPEGQRGVAEVIRNRAQSGKFGGDITKVILAPKQFSLWNPGDPAGDLARRVTPGSPQYQKVGKIVDQVMSNQGADVTGGATHYYNPKVVAPAWGPELAKQNDVRIGNHRFVGSVSPPEQRLASTQGFAEGGAPQEVLTDDQVLARHAGPPVLTDDQVLEQTGLSKQSGFSTMVTKAAQAAVSGVGTAMKGAAEMLNERPEWDPVTGVSLTGGMTPEELEDYRHGPGTPPTELGLYKAGERTEKFGQENFPVNPREEAAHPMESSIGAGVGSLATLVPAAMVPGVGPFLGAGLMATQGAGAAGEAARAKGADEATVHSAAELNAFANAGLGATDIGMILKPVARSTPGMVGWVKDKLLQAARNGAVFDTVNEAMNFVGQQIAQNFYDPQAGYAPQVKELIANFLVGGIFGFGSPLEAKHGTPPAPGTPPAAEGSPGTPPGTPPAAAPPPPGPGDKATPVAPPAGEGQFRAGVNPKTGLFHVADGDGNILSEPFDRQEEAHAAAARLNLQAIVNPPAAPTPPPPAASEGMPAGDPRATPPAAPTTAAGIQAEAQAKGLPIPSAAEAQQYADDLNEIASRKQAPAAAAHPTAPEPASDLRAQLEAMVNPDHPKDAVFVARGNEGQIPDDLPASAPPTRRPEGTLFTTNPEKAAAFRDAPQVTDDLMGRILGYPDTKANVAAAGQGAVVEARDKAGNVIAGAATSPERAQETQAAIGAQVPPGGHLATVTPQEALRNRLQKVSQEQGAAGPPLSDDEAIAQATEAAKINAGANQAHPAPSDAQKEAGNYQKGPVKFQGLDISVETPKGATRTGVGPDGQPWQNTSPAHYGYIRGTEGSDDEHLDAYIGQNPRSDRVFVFDQVDPQTGAFDEHKVVLGVDSRAQARRIYDGGFSDGSGPDRRRHLTEMPMADFKQWLKMGDTKAALGPLPTNPSGVAPTGRPEDIIQFLARNGGLNPTGDLRAMDAHKKFVPGYGMLVRRDGHGLDEDHAREIAEEAGFLPRGSDITDLHDAIDETLRGNPRFRPEDALQYQAWRRDRQGYDGEYRVGAEQRAHELGLDIDPNAPTDDIVAEIAEREAIMAEGAGADAAADHLDQDIDRVAAMEDIPWLESTDERQAQTGPQPGPVEAPRSPEGQPEPVPGAEARPAQPGAGGEGGGPAAPQGNGPRGAVHAPTVEQTAAGAQTVLPGAEQSAKQAAAAQEAFGHGKIRPKTAQEEANEGLFAPPPDTTGNLLAQPAAVPAHTEIGKNADGQPIFQDARGVRSVVENGVRRFETVSMVPTREGVQIATTRGADPAFEISPQGPHVAIAAMVTQDLERGHRITAQRLKAMAQTAFGSELSEGKFDRSDMYDALELGVNRYIKNHPERFDPRGDVAVAQAAVLDLEKIKNELPTQTVRAGEKEAYQQFSTPPDYSYAVAWLAHIGDHDRVIEPSAGTGSLAVHGMNARPAEVTTNELSGQRADMLASLGGAHHAFRENAEQLHNILPDEVKPSVVLMNPPFSRSAERLGEKTDTSVGASHVEQALKRLEPGGRLVAIVGGGMKMESATFRDWWKKIGAQYDVRANVGVGGGVYAKYGTTFPTRLLVIDKPAEGAAPSGRAPDVGEVKNIPELISRLEDVRNDRIPARESVAAQPGGEAVAPSGPARGGPERPVSPAAPEQRIPEGRPAARPGEPVETRPGIGGGEPVPERPREGNALAGEQPERPGAAGADANAPGGPRPGEDVATGRPGDDGVVRGPDGGGRSELPDTTADIEAPAAETTRVDEAVANPEPGAGISEAVYEPYKPQRVSIKGAQPHPGELVQSAAMASVMPPETDYAPKIPQALIADGALSEAQLEPVIYAGRAHAQMLPAAEGEQPTRRGFMIGDGTGAGKGRENAGIILDNWNQGRRKAVWLSEKKTLLTDAKRDWEGLGQDPNHIFELGKTKPGSAIDAKKGILFSTYDTLRGGEKIGKDERGRTKLGKTRVDQIVDWFGKNFDGVIVLDEAHNLANATATAGARGLKDPSAKALAGIELQKRLPNARVVYSSATGATEVSNLAYAERLGLWGRGTAFPTRADFISKIEASGIAGMELVARDMKALGSYIARNLSYSGVEYNRLEHVLDPDQRAIYDRLAEAWQVTLNHFNEALEITGGAKNGKAKSSAASAFWGAHQRFFNQIVTSMQMPTVVKSIERDLAEKRQAVLQLTNTNEASQERALAKASPEDLEDLDMTPRDQLLQMVAHSFPVAEHEEYMDESGKVRSRPVLDANGVPVENKEALARRAQLLQDLADIRVPSGPLDILMDHFGTDKVAEVTGRKQRVVLREDENGRMKKMPESRPGSSNLVEADAFQKAEKPILVFSQAGGTGRSYHAENGTPSADFRRSHYLVQAGWRADAAIQGFGRTHRTNEASQPIFHLVTTDLKGQKRFISSIARRLAQLGALTKGERRTGDQGLFSARDNLESREAKDALYQFYTDLHEGKIPEVSIGEFQQQTGLRLLDSETGALRNDLPPIPQFLNRLLSLKVDMQNTVFDAFDQRLGDKIDAGAAAGTLDTGTETVRGDKITKEQEHPVYKDPGTGAETKYVRLTVHNKNKPVSFDQIQGGHWLLRGEPPQFYAASARTGKIYGVGKAQSTTDAKTGHIVDQYRLADQLDYRYIARSSLDDRRQKQWQIIRDPAQARAAWDAQFAKVPEYNSSPLHLITGAVLPIWDRLKGNPKVQQLQTDAGERLLGRVIPVKDLNETLKALGADGAKAKEAPEKVIAHVLAGGGARLANGWTLRRSIVAGEPRIEIIGPDWNYGRELVNDGVFSEKIGWQSRYFIPTGEDAAAVLAKVTERRPVAEMYGGGEDVALQRNVAPKAPTEPTEPVKRMQITSEGHAEQPKRWFDNPGKMTPEEKQVIDRVQGIIKKLAPQARSFPVTRLEHMGEEIQGATIRTKSFPDLILWALNSGDPEHTARHEVIHSLRRSGLITPDEWSVLAGRAEKEDWLDKYNIEKRYPGLDHDKQIEEAVAEHFGDWRREGSILSRLPEWLKPIFYRLDLFARQVAAAARKAFGADLTASDIYTGIERGEIGSREAPPRGEESVALQRQGANPDEEEPDLPEGFGGKRLADPAGRNVVGYLKDRIETLTDITKELAQDVQMKVAPMAAGSDTARAAAKDLANSTRLAHQRGIKADEYLKKNFSLDQQRRMWEAADEESVLAQVGQSAQGAGFNRLSDKEREAVQRLQEPSRRAFDAAVKLGMVEGDGLPFYVPRMVVAIGSDGVKRVGGERGKITAMDPVGRNLRTTTSQLMHRKHLTAEETEEAAKVKFGAEAAVARDIRALPLATARLEEAVAGRTLINQIKQIGKDSGQDLVFEGHEGPAGSTFTLDHPAFKTWRPKFETGADGKVQVKTDANGDPIFERIPLYVSRDFEGPLRAVLSRDSGAVYKAFMALKGKTMSVVMYSPLIHNAVEWGRALPAMPGRVVTFRVYFDGNKAKNDPATMTEAISHGLVPIGHRYGMQDITSIMEEPNLAPGRSWTAKLAGALPGLFDAAAGTHTSDFTKRMVDKAGDVWHNTLLWDRVADLQMGLYVGLRDRMTAKGYDASTAQYVAAHFANRYAGALPIEAMSTGARKFANFALFSRSFTLGNLGAMKDMVAGLPRDVQAQIKRDAGMQALDRLATMKDAQSLARRKAIATIALDVILMYVGNAVLQNAAAVLSGDSTIGDEAQGYARRLNALMQRAQDNPLDVITSPFKDIQSLTPQGENEPSMKNRVLVGYGSDGTAIYMRNPTGKIGEEMTGWPTGPLDMLNRKMSTIARPIMQTLTNDRGFGRKVYNPNADTLGGWAKNIGHIVALFMGDQVPLQSISAAIDTLHGRGDLATNALQVAGPLAGLTFSKGAPGGPAVGEMYHAREEHEFNVQQALPGIRQKIQSGDVDGARKDMTDLGIPPRLQAFYIKTTENPRARLTPHQLRDFERYATPDQKRDMQRHQGAQQP